ncbi:hypothetical protein ONZ45_g665 [Pleurotus djamor]|nr:hypothetical protein ONZ45_g665 [Pleurotus djamor]
MQFFLDGQLAGAFTHNPPGTLGYDYNVTVFSKISLEPGEHELRIQNGRIGGPTALILLDAIIYTQNVDDVDDAAIGDQKVASTPARSRVIPVAIGSTVGALLVLGLSVFFYLRHRRRGSTDKEANVPTGRRLFILPSAPSPITPFPSHLVSSTDRFTQELKIDSLRSGSAHYRSSNILGPQHSATSDGRIIPFVSDNGFSSGQPTVWDVSTPASSRGRAALEDGAPPPPYEGMIVPNRGNLNRASVNVKRYAGNPQ